VLTCYLILALVTPVSFDRISIAFFSLDSSTRLDNWKMSTGKLDYDTMQAAVPRINAIGDYELDLRALKVAKIENLFLTKDQYETIDLSHNEIRVLDNFPLLTRLKALLLTSNRIYQIDDALGKYVPNLTHLMLNSNHLALLGCRC
jgi:Leucine-rich repeat (LRR) protein